MNAEKPSGPSPLIICPDAALAEDLCRALSEIGVANRVVLADYPGPERIASLRERHGCSVVFIDVGSDPDISLRVLASCAREGPTMAVHRGNDADVILRCLRSGASEFLFPPFGPEVLRAALDRAKEGQEPTAGKKSGSVYCVVPGKAGCGASTVCAHLAVEAKRRGAARVLAADFDSLTSSLRFYLKLKSDYHAGHVIREWKRMDQELWSRLVAGAHGIDVLSGPESPGLIEMDAHFAAEFLSFCRERYEAVFLDTAGAGSVSAQALAAAADCTLLVTTNELAALYTTRRSLEYLEAAGLSRNRVRLLVNRYTPAISLKREDVEKALDTPVFAVLANDYASIQDALLDGKPVARTSPFGRSVAELAARLAGAAAAKPSKEQRSWLFRMRKGASA